MRINLKKITTKDNYFITNEGTPFLAKGINMTCKDKSRGYIGDYTEKDFKWLAEKGFNLIRLGIFWDGAEPIPGEYNEKYFSKIDKIIDMAANEGICVFLDMHQDLYSSLFEDGAPSWATITDGAEYEKTELWSDAYLVNEAVQRAFDNFWLNRPASDGVGIKTRYINLWKYISKRYSKDPYVIGYDVMNEPFPGSEGGKVAMILAECMQEEDLTSISEEKIFSIIEKIAPVTGKFDKEVLQPFYNEIAEEIRSEDSETIIMFEHGYFSNAGIPSALESLKTKDGKVISYQAYAPHGYDILVDTEEYHNDAGLERVDLIFGSVFENAKRLNIPTLIGEWGCYPQAKELQKIQAKHLLELFKTVNVGNVYYDFSHIYDGGIISVL